MDPAHAFRENQPLLVLLLAEANSKCKGELLQPGLGVVSNQSGFLAVPYQGDGS